MRILSDPGFWHSLWMTVWYMDIDTTAKYKSGVTTVKDSVRLDPWVFMFSAGYRF